MNPGNASLPTGTVTFLFSDIEGSTRLLQANPADYARILNRHREILEAAVLRRGGSVVDMTGDSLFAAFGRAADAILAAAEGRRAIDDEPWPDGIVLRVRMGLHTGEPTLGAGGYVGIDVHRAARIASAAHGGQILCSRTTHELVEPSLPAGIAVKDLGYHRLKDLRSSERLFQLERAGEAEEFPPVRSLEGYAHNLPFQMNEIIGRGNESSEVRRLLEAHRLVTLVGPGGIGKTRLALDVAAASLELFKNGVWYVQLASLLDPDLLVQTVAGVLGVREHSDSPIEDLLIDFLSSRQLLLVLDNCEHLLDPCAKLSNRLLQSCGELRILATSREAYGIPGEWVRRVPSLGVPSRDAAGVSEIARSESARLFIERARALSNSFSLTEENAPALAEICRRLDGIPLAIELAASRSKLLSIEEIAKRLDDRFRLLTGGTRTALPRQQTLKALMDWSYGLLSRQEQRMLRRLSVFCCGWTLESAESICGGSGVEAEEVLDLVTALVDKSLVTVEGGTAENQFRLLETIRQYAQEKLLDEGESEALRDRHLAYFVDFVEKADAMLRGAEQKRWLAALDRHDDELRGALGWASTRRAVEQLERLATSLWRYWRVRSNFTEGRRWLEEAITLSAEVDDGGLRESVRLRSLCLISAGSLANYQGDYIRAAQVLTEGLGLCRSIDDQLGIANSLAILAHARLMTGEDDEAAEMLEESLEIFSRLGKKRGVGYANYCLGSLMVRRGEYARAREYLDTGLSLMEELEDSWWIENTLLELGWANGRLGDEARALDALERAQAIAQSFNDRRGRARALMHVAGVKLAGGKVTEAGKHYRESLALFVEIGDRWGVVSCVEGIAAVATRREKQQEAVRLLGAAERIRDSLKSTVRALDRREQETLVEEAENALGEKEFHRFFDEGGKLTYQNAVDRALTLEL